MAEGLISPQLVGAVMTTFDKCINKALSERARNKVTFKVVEKYFNKYIKTRIQYRLKNYVPIVFATMYGHL
jgi:hypothetical protein